MLKRPDSIQTGKVTQWLEPMILEGFSLSFFFFLLFLKILLIYIYIQFAILTI